MNLNQVHTVYFIGIGGIGMSALARYFKSRGHHVLGYDKTSTKLTQLLESEGIDVHYEDWGEKALNGLDSKSTLVIYTPAIPAQHMELNAFVKSDFYLIKRAKALGLISEDKETFAVAGTHGKTTTSSVLAHVLHQTKESCNAFIGGITTNYHSNCIIDDQSDRVVVEADEFDRSFLQLTPNYIIITTTDADHLDIYGEEKDLQDSFIDFAELTAPYQNKKGIILVHSDVYFKAYGGGCDVYTYGFDIDADWQGSNLHYGHGMMMFDIKYQGQLYANVEFGLPGKHNAENALAVFALLITYGVDEQTIRQAFKTYKGVKRRFEYHIKRDDLVMIDDYAHHPTEMTALIQSVREIYPNKEITLVFQPHLFSRTRDFMPGFVKALKQVDKLYLLDIYPARELPIEGVNSQLILNQLDLDKKQLSTKETIVRDLKQDKHQIILVVGAGDIDTCIDPIKEAYQ